MKDAFEICVKFEDLLQLSATSTEEELWSKLSVAALPAEEKDKLYRAIDYNESVRVKYPTEVRTVA